MFLCECDSCGRRELRGPRSLVITPLGATATCRACGSVVLVGAGRPPALGAPVVASAPVRSEAAGEAPPAHGRRLVGARS